VTRKGDRHGQAKFMGQLSGEKGAEFMARARTDPPKKKPKKDFAHWLATSPEQRSYLVEVTSRRLWERSVL